MHKKTVRYAGNRHAAQYGPSRKVFPITYTFFQKKWANKIQAYTGSYTN
jgi:hypothetical protein